MPDALQSELHMGDLLSSAAHPMHPCFSNDSYTTPFIVVSIAIPFRPLPGLICTYYRIRQYTQGV